MALTAGFDLKTKSYDIINAYVNASLRKPTYYQMPPGFEHLGRIWEVLKALYKLKHSANLWYYDFVGTLQRLGLHQVPGINCLFSNKWLTLLFYVDDIVVVYASKHQSKFDAFEKELLSSYKIRSLSQTENFLRIRVLRDRSERKLWLMLNAFCKRITNKFHIPLDIQTFYTPLPPSVDLFPLETQASKAHVNTYQ